MPNDWPFIGDLYGLKSHCQSAPVSLAIVTEPPVIGFDGVGPDIVHPTQAPSARVRDANQTTTQPTRLMRTWASWQPGMPRIIFGNGRPERVGGPVRRRSEAHPRWASPCRGLRG